MMGYPKFLTVGENLGYDVLVRGRVSERHIALRNLKDRP